MTQQVNSYWSPPRLYTTTSRLLFGALLFCLTAGSLSTLQARPAPGEISSDTLIEATICAEQTYQFDGQELHISGEYKASFEAADGSDSIVTLLLTVLPPLEETLNVSICLGESYVFFGSELDESGAYTAVIPGSNGCDSTITLQLTVLQPSFTNLSAGICTGAYYLYQGDTLTETGTYLYGFTAANGCDSIVRLRLDVVDYFDQHQQVTICNGETFEFGGVLLDTTGVYVDSLTAIGGCDSIVTLTLTVLPPLTSDLNVSICDGSYYIYHGDTLNTDGTYLYPEPALNGCDSLVRLHLTLVPFFEIHLEAAICKGETYILGTQELSSDGEYKEIFTASGGCDSIVYLNLTVLPLLTGVDSATICDGTTYNYHGTELDVSGDYEFILEGTNGCDSVVTFTLTVLDIANTVLEAVICSGETYIFYGEQLDSSGVYEHTFTAVSGCDSVITLVLTVREPVLTELEASICAGETYVFNGEALDSSGLYSAQLKDEFGCDSTVTLTLTVFPVHNTTLNVVLCAGEFYDLDGTVIDESGTYIAVFKDVNGCDSTVTVHLEILPEKESSIEASICKGSSYMFNGSEIKDEGVYTAVLEGEYGCDSTVTLTLVVLPTSLTELDATICQGDTYNYYGQQLTEAGSYEFSFTGENGCDSIVVVNITVKPLQYNSTDVEICYGESFEFDGVTLTETGAYTFTYPGSNGCDSVFIVYLTVHPTFNSTLYVTQCTGQPYEFNGVSLVAEGTYIAEYTNVYGCDSTVTLNLTFTNMFESSSEASICAGESYVFDSDTLTESGVYSHSYSATGGCDSLVTLYLTVLPITQTEVNAVICDGSTYNFQGAQLSEAGDYEATLTAFNGCDSIVTLHLKLLPKSQSTLDVTICANESYPFNGALLDESGVYTGVFANANGCDSTVTLNLTVLPPVQTNSQAMICAGETYVFNGATLTQSGTYTTTYIAANGCDSIVSLALQVLPLSQGGFAATVCGNEPFEYNGQVLSQSGTYQFVLDGAAANGCDSLVTLFLTIFPEIPPTTVNPYICAGETYAINGQNLSQEGQYTFNLSSSTGCDSLVVVNLHVLPGSATALTATICDGQSYDFYGTPLTQAGTYTHILQNQNGCDSVITLTLYPLVIPPLTITMENGTLSVHEGLPLSYIWVNCDTQQPVQGATGTSFTPTVTGNYAVVGVTSSGCTTTSTCVNVTVSETKEPVSGADWRILPNPAGALAHVAFTRATESELLLEISDPSGRLLRQQVLPAGAMGTELDIRDCPNGILMVRLRNAAGVTSKMLMKGD